MHTRVLLALSVALAAPTLAQENGSRRDRDRITRAELARYGTMSLREVIQRSRPHFFFADPTRHQGGRTRSGVVAPVAPWRLLVYVGEQVHDPDVLDLYRADEVAEIRYYKTVEAATRLRTNNASVIHVVRTQPSRERAPTG